MRSARAVEDAFLDDEDRKAVRIAVEHGAAHAAAGRRAGDEQRVDAFAREIGDQVRAEERARARLVYDELAFARLDRLGKLRTDIDEVFVLDLALGRVAHDGLKFRIAGRIDDWHG